MCLQTDGLVDATARPGLETASGREPHALVLSCAHLSAAKRGQVPFEGTHDYAELAVDRLLAGGQRLREGAG